ncbi:hypothetical protein BJV74DRAFT_30087 [Russula compacta]|nr:hypothetical protein BJV74DRAFT_30087 [Russula compacta]
MAFSPSPKSSPKGARSSPSPSGQRTLTPQRKHRKMLKDGTSEVWPESVEKIFVDGLRQYWESPWATYSRGRSRWRNQFLVDYLKEAGIERSKKQVASHIQVLRNMWKGEKEYQLVAGGEELFQENGLLAHKSGPSCAAPPSDVHVKEELKEMQSPFARRSPSDGGDFPSESESTGLDALHALEMPSEHTQGALLARLPLPPTPRSSNSSRPEAPSRMKVLISISPFRRAYPRFRPSWLLAFRRLMSFGTASPPSRLALPACGHYSSRWTGTHRHHQHQRHPRFAITLRLFPSTSNFPSPPFMMSRARLRCTAFRVPSPLPRRGLLRRSA